MMITDDGIPAHWDERDPAFHMHCLKQEIERLTAENTDWQILCEILMAEMGAVSNQAQDEFNRLAHRAVSTHQREKK